MSSVLLMAVLSLVCGKQGRDPARPASVHSDRMGDLHTLALWFAPILYLHPDEPSEIMTVIPVFHPTKPIVAYHIFFDDDAFLAGRGKDIDHEVVWVEYDPINLKVEDVLTLWHRTVLRTDACVLDARRPEQRPRISVQWGQHGMLPLGWENLTSARPRLELRMHYNLARYINRIPLASPKRPVIAFAGSYEEYLTFTEAVDTSIYIEERDTVIAEDCEGELRLRIHQSLSIKKQWPDW